METLRQQDTSMRSHELLSTILHQHSAKAIAAHLNLSVPRVYQWAEPPKPEGRGGPNPLDRIAGLLSVTRDERIAHWICQYAEGFFVRNANPDDLSREHLMKATDQLIRQFAEMLTLVSTSVVDGQITKEESADLRLKWQHIQSIAESYVRECEKGSFRPKPPQKDQRANGSKV